MRYQNPQLLIALLAIAIPIIIHLFNLRKYRVIRFSSIRLLKEITKAKRSQSRIKNILILLTRIFTLTFLILAFSKPYIPLDEKKSTLVKEVFIYIDNSFSMESVAADGMLLDKAKNTAIKISNMYDNSCDFYLINNDFLSKHNKALTRNEIQKLIQQIDVSPQYRSINDIINRVQSLDKKNQNTHLYLISDLQQSTFLDNKEIKEDSNINIIILPLNNTIDNNIYIDSCWLSSPIIRDGKNIEIFATLHNISNKEISNLPAFLHVNGQQKAISNFSILPNERKEISFNFTPLTTGFKHCKISFQDYPITFDDNFYFSFKILEQINVMSVYEDQPSLAFKSLYQDDKIINYNEYSIRKIKYEEIKNHQLLILDEIDNISTGFQKSIANFVKNGGSLAILPSEDINYENYNNLCELLIIDKFLSIDTVNQPVNILSYNHKIFNGVFKEKEDEINLPMTYSHYNLSSLNRSNRRTIFELEIGDPFINHYTFFNGDIYLFASTLNDKWTNLTKHALFVPLMYNMALISSKRNRLYHRIYESNFYDAPKSNMKDIPFHLKSQDIDIIPTKKFIGGKWQLFFQQEIEKAGNYLVTQANDTLSTLSFNYGNKESLPSTFRINDIKDIIKKNKLNNITINKVNNQSINNIVKQNQLGKSYWKHCIILALIFLLIEIILIKNIKI
tara:strand:- start:17533 stop:19563 length:2031 start_codon:yes stop_codon:yes gene_type:complete